MAKLSPQPHHAEREMPGRKRELHPSVWWYEEPNHISLQIAAHPGHISARIPIRQLRAYLKRHDTARADAKGEG